MFTSRVPDSITIVDLILAYIDLFEGPRKGSDFSSEDVEHNGEP